MAISQGNSIQVEGLLVKEFKDSGLWRDSSSWIDDSLVQELRNALGNSTVLTPESEGYQASIKRWSDAIEKRAVSQI